MKNFFKKPLNCYHRIQKAIIVVLFMVAVAVSFFQILNRMIFKLPIAWTEEMARYLLIWLTFLSAVVATRTGSMAAIDILTMRFSGIVRLIANIFQTVVSTAFVSIVTVNLLKVMALQIETGQLTPALKISMSIPYFSIAVWGVLSVLELLLLLVQSILNKEEPAQDVAES